MNLIQTFVDVLIVKKNQDDNIHEVFCKVFKSEDRICLQMSFVTHSKMHQKRSQINLATFLIIEKNIWPESKVNHQVFM